MTALSAFWLLATPAARAGHWVVSYACKGNDVVYYNDGHFPFRQNPGPYNYPWASPTTTASFGAGNGRYHVNWGTSSGSITATLTWTLDGTGDTSKPPTSIILGESASASGISGNQTHPASASDGLSDTPVGNSSGQTSSGTLWKTVDNTSASTTVTLPPCTMSATGVASISNYATSISYQIQLSGPPKSVMIGGSGNIYSNGQWQGQGDSIFNNVEYDPVSGYPLTPDQGTLDFGASLIGSPWDTNSNDYDLLSFPYGFIQRQYHWYCDVTGTSLSGQSDDGSIPGFSVQRPNRDWPYGTDGILLPRDLLEQ